MSVFGTTLYERSTGTSPGQETVEHLRSMYEGGCRPPHPLPLHTSSMSGLATLVLTNAALSGRGRAIAHLPQQTFNPTPYVRPRYARPHQCSFTPLTAMLYEAIQDLEEWLEWRNWQENENTLETNASATGFSPATNAPYSNTPESNFRANAQKRLERANATLVPSLEPHGPMCVGVSKSAQLPIGHTSKATSSSQNRSLEGLFSDNAVSQWEFPSHWKTEKELKNKPSHTAGKMASFKITVPKRKVEVNKEQGPILKKSKTKYSTASPSKTSRKRTSPRTSVMERPLKRSRPSTKNKEAGPRKSLYFGETPEPAKQQPQSQQALQLSASTNPASSTALSPLSC